MTRPIYLDNSATTMPFKEVVEDFYNNYSFEYFNPSSLYKPSLIVRNKVENCREKISQMLSCKANNVFFLASGTDANNLAILSYKNKLKKDDVVLYSAIEHPSVTNTCKELERYGVIVKSISVNKNGFIDLDQLQNLLDEKVKLICIMHVNNEVGSVNDLKTICSIRDKFAPNASIHIDGVQGFLKVPFSFKDYDVQSYSLSAHKIHGFKGTGVLAINNFKPQPYRFGGGQEMGIVSGTENTIGIIALDKAIDIYNAFPNASIYMRNLKTQLVNCINDKIPNSVIIGPDPFNENISSPNIINIAFSPLRSDVMLNALDARDIYVSSGSACSSKRQKISPVLKELNIPNDIAESAIRFSLSILNSSCEIAETVDAISEIYNKYSKYVRR